MLEDTAGCWPG